MNRERLKELIVVLKEQKKRDESINRFSMGLWGHVRNESHDKFKECDETTQAVVRQCVLDVLRLAWLHHIR